MNLKILISVGLAAMLQTAAASAQDAAHAYTTDLPFAEAISALEDALINRGYVIDHRGNVGDMLDRTAEAVGAEADVYVHAEFLQFCSAVLSRRMMEADIANIAFCPYVLLAYEATASPGIVTLGYRPLPEGPGRDDVTALLDEIIREAAAGF